MPVLRYIADTNAISDYQRGEPSVRDWFARHRGQVGLTTLTLAEIRRGIELKQDSKARRKLEKFWKFVTEDYAGRTFVFDEAAAAEWGRMMARHNGSPIPYDDSLIGAIALSCGMIVVTRNEKHFPGCRTVNPWAEEPSVE
jgi:hypothetical protein